ncbi:MAG: glycerophosphoryl diester phosphodiesterase [Planctomycetes bacterium]|nr:glycerophosphoryl diester phosphodiesterase [Planctomycetota bacterium]
MVATAILLTGRANSKDNDAISLENKNLNLRWEQGDAGWKLADVNVLIGGEKLSLGNPSGEYTVLYSQVLPSTDGVKIAGSKLRGRFWEKTTTKVALNRDGEAIHFYPQQAVRSGDGAVEFTGQTAKATVKSEWRLDPLLPSDIRVKITLTAKVAGYFSIATPTLASVPADELSWVTVPGVFAGNKIEKSLDLALGYAQGLPAEPVLATERTATYLTSVITHKSGATVAVIAEPGTANDPWEYDKHSRQVWRLGLSHMNRRKEFASTLYHPVLGQADSMLKAGESKTFEFRYSLSGSDWYGALKHVAYDIYKLKDFFTLKKFKQSLSERVYALHDYVTDTKTSLWRVEKFNGREIGAQAYLSGVHGAKGKDAMKNSDYGAMWMLAKQTNNPILVNERLPYARNFKIEQQQAIPGEQQGAALGQYYLSNSKKFTEEWGDYIEPVGTTYYVLSDLGNIALFEPENTKVRERIRLAADRLLKWQHADGSWEVAYANKTGKPTLTDLTDYRPTFYGLIIAYRILGDDKYLQGAIKAANWLLVNAIEPLKFLGVCGDARFVPDFSTAQIAQGMFELHDLTNDKRYQDAAIRTTKFYATSVFIHPIASNATKLVKGRALADWQINQTGLSFEHGGTRGTANGHGPILLASHAGLFIRTHQLTGDPLLKDLARAGVLARTEAFVEPKTNVASYYYSQMNLGAGTFPHHAWWQIGWITDYLISEAMLRTDNKVTFPRGFFTPKVGPHAAYGFAPGEVYGDAASLIRGNAHLNRSDVETVMAKSEDGKTYYTVLMNVAHGDVNVKAAPSAAELTGKASAKWADVSLINGEKLSQKEDAWTVTIPGNGAVVLKLTVE